MNSVLNPEAPEFYPHLTCVTQAGYTKVNKSIRSSNQMPTGASYELFKTIADFDVVANQLSENVVQQSNKILHTEISTVKLKRIDIEYNTDIVADANDSILDRVNINMDTLKGVNRPSQLTEAAAKKSGISVSPWNTTPVIAKIQVGSTTLIGAKNIPRPQLMFKDPLDNSTNMWVPRISDKPNSIKPLALNILYNDEGEAVGYEHPYKVELDLYHPPGCFIDPDPTPPEFPKPLEETSLTYVDTEQQLDALVEHLTSVAEFAVDVEHHSYRSYQGITCLVQISTNEGGDFIIDTLALREHIHKLNLVFTDPKKLKVFHGAEMDVMWLQRDFGVYVVGLFDTHQAARALQAARLSLKYLLCKYCRVDADKKYQLADWRIRPLPDELVTYARMDTHYLLYIWRQMKEELLRKGGGPQLLLSVFEQSRQICGTTYNKTVVHENSHLSLYLRSKKSFNSQQMAALKMLYKWRDAQARALDEGTIYLLPNHMLLQLAETLPREVQGVSACCSPMPPFVKQNLIAIHRMLLSCRELPVEPQLYPMPAGIHSVINSQPTSSVFQLHDFAHYKEYSDEQPVDLDRTAFILADLDKFQPDIQAFVPTYNTDSYCAIVSDLNVDAKQFVPPYDRYRKYRSLAQMEEMREFRDKEAKITAIGKGDELIKTEVLNKLQQAKSQIEHDVKAAKEINGDINYEIIKLGSEEENGAKIRKRKMSAESEQLPRVKVLESKELKPNVKHKPEAKNDVKPYLYKNANYKKFYDNTARAHKPKTKFKNKKH
ncbi:LOW QUALITY PROTEIN: exosome component Rrp6 [Choristoneura fumiferana]|uniref:LOW QUALITY PROTEIN: exosome component Rrp6 n=1 Tax=Choristoneura fumiferana TaxID=7141 RepID=UPI003D1581D5